MALMLAEQRREGLVQGAEGESPPPARPLLQLEIGVKEFVPAVPSTAPESSEPHLPSGHAPPPAQPLAAVPAEPLISGAVPSFLRAAEPSLGERAGSPAPTSARPPAPAFVSPAAPLEQSPDFVTPPQPGLVSPAAAAFAQAPAAPVPAFPSRAPVAPAFLAPPEGPPSAFVPPAAPAFLAPPEGPPSAFVPPAAPAFLASPLVPAAVSREPSSPEPRSSSTSHLADPSLPDFLRVSAPARTAEGSAAAERPSLEHAGESSQATYLEAIAGGSTEAAPSPSRFPEVVANDSPRLSLLGWFGVRARLASLTSPSEQARLLAAVGLDQTTWLIEERIWRTLITSCPMTQAMYEELLGSTP